LELLFFYEKVISTNFDNFLYFQTYFWEWVCHAAEQALKSEFGEFALM